MKKAAAGSVLVAGVLTALFGGTGTAQAAPGVSLDPGTNGEHTIGIGDQKPGGAVAVASKGNAAMAVNFGLSPVGSQAYALGGQGNTGLRARRRGRSRLRPQGSDRRSREQQLGGGHRRCELSSRQRAGQPHLQRGQRGQSTGSTNNTAAFCGGSLNAQSATLSSYKIPAGKGSLC